MHTLVKCLSTTFTFLVIGCAMIWAQAGSTAQISGTVRDQSGAVLPGVEVTATQTETGISRSTLSNETGSYVVPNLPVGPYRLEVSLPGFRMFVQTGILLQVNSNPVINATLELGQVTEQVEVQANAALVETRSTSVGQVIENERILELPLNGRQVTDLITLAGAAVQTESASSRAMPGGQGISVAGALSTGVSYVLDGAIHNNPYDNFNLPLPFPDALQEFKVETSALTAQNGMHAGAAVNAVTKSGTNELHGDALWFVRNEVFNATSPFAGKRADGKRQRDGLKRNQFGGTLGGPIMKNKLFFFGGYQGTLLRQATADNITFVPTAAMVAGDFTAFAAPSCNGGRQLTLTGPFVNNRVNPSLLSKASLNITSKLPKTDDPCGRTTFRNVIRTNSHQGVGKADYQTGNHTIFGRYLVTTDTSPVPFTLSGNLLTTFFGGRDNLAQSYTAGDTWLINANTVNSARFAVNRTAIHRLGASFFNAPSVGVNTFSYLPDYMIVTASGGFNIGNGVQTDSTFRTTTYQIADDVSLVRGTHQMSFGGGLAHWRSNSYANVRSPGSFTFNGQATGAGLADFLTGNLFQFIQSTPNNLIMREWYVGLYAQDTWKATPRLTLNYGLRWEPFLPEQLTKGTIYNFDLQRFRQGARSAEFKKAPAGFYYPGDPGFPSNSGMYKRWKDFAPRVGLAWDPKGDGRTSIRAAWGLFYDFVDGQFHLNTANAPPWGLEVRLNSPTGGFDDPFRGVAGGNPHPATFDANALFTAFGPFITTKFDTKRPTENSWNLSVQRQFGADWLVSTSYLGSQTFHTWNLVALNPAIFQGASSTTTNTNQRRRLFLENPQEAQFIGDLDLLEDSGTSSYHGLLTSVQRRLSHGVSASGNYTWSHCIGDPVQGSPPNVANGYTDPSNRKFDRGNCNSDRRHIVNVTTVAETPRFANNKLRVLATGWRVSGIYRYSTGRFLSVVTGQDRALNGISGNLQRVNQGLANPYGDRSVENYLNRAAFAQPALGTFGNLGRNSIQGPATWTLDVALSRVFKIREGHRMEIRAEAYNLTNSFRKDNPITNLTSPSFGQVLAALDPRIMQFALKYVF